jgi:hypothetical protein
MNIQTVPRDQILKGEIQGCAALLAGKRAELARLRQRLASLLDAEERERLLAAKDALVGRGNILSHRLDELQKEQRLRARSRGVAMGTTRLDWP